MESEKHCNSNVGKMCKSGKDELIENEPTDIVELKNFIMILKFHWRAGKMSL